MPADRNSVGILSVQSVRRPAEAKPLTIMIRNAHPTFPNGPRHGTGNPIPPLLSCLAHPGVDALRVRSTFAKRQDTRRQERKGERFPHVDERFDQTGDMYFI